MLSFSAEVFESFLAQYNREIWPAQAVAQLLALTAFGFAFRPRPTGIRAVGIVLAAFWRWTGLRDFHGALASVSFAAPAIGIGFAFEGVLLLLWTLRARPAPAPRRRGDAGRPLGMLLAALGLLWPAVESLSGVPSESLRSLGTTALPTVLFTLGLLLVATERPPVWLIAVPILWSLAGGLAAYGLGLWRDLAMPAAGLAVVVAIVVHRMRTPKPASG